MQRSGWKQWSITALAAFGLAASKAEGAGTDTLDVLRRRATDDIFVLRDYRAGKNSFVESPERHPGAWTQAGYRHTLLDVKGEGSLRHIWTTRGEGEPYFDWEFYVDGETEPSLRGTDVDLIRAAEQLEVPVAPANFVPLGNRDFNLFLPVPFERSLRVDVVQRVPSFWLWFCQLDYRVGDDSLRGVRAETRGTGENLTFHYTGLGKQEPAGPPKTPPLEHYRLPAASIPAGERRMIQAWTGPAIVRELRLHWPPESGLRLQLRFDHGDGFAVDSPIDRFFGPFQGASFYRHGEGDSSCYLPMPFRKRGEVWIVNSGSETATVGGEAAVEPVASFAPSWGYFHAKHQITRRTNGHRLHQVLYARGRGHWLGMSLYHTGHDHGGGDFAVLDGEGNRPAFLHGVNGEDYFTFAWFGKGAHHPYAVAHTNDEGRYRHHFENVYPFHQSIAIEWGAFADLSPESVAVWYQQAPDDTTVPDGARSDSIQWDVFGPVPLPAETEEASATQNPYQVLPSIAELDAGKQFECRLVEEHFESGWMKEWSVGPTLNLTYLGRHGTPIGYEAELGGTGHAMLARRFLNADYAGEFTCRFAHDDPVEVEVNGTLVYQATEPNPGFQPTAFRIPLQKGKNQIVVRLTNYFNRTFNWAGFWMRIPELEAKPEN